VEEAGIRAPGLSLSGVARPQARVRGDDARLPFRQRLLETAWYNKSNKYLIYYRFDVTVSAMQHVERQKREVKSGLRYGGLVALCER
jgi:hypothetical protein